MNFCAVFKLFVYSTLFFLFWRAKATPPLEGVKISNLIISSSKISKQLSLSAYFLYTSEVCSEASSLKINWLHKDKVK